jgi:membrane-associated phospholipid phosphatase
MSNFLDALGWFTFGFATGYFWYPLWQLGKKIVAEAKLAREEWRNPRG